MSTRVTLSPRRGAAPADVAVRLNRPNLRRPNWIMPAGNGTGVTALGDVLVTTGTAAGVVPTATVPWQNISMTTAGTLDAQGLVTGVGIHRWSQKPLFQCLHVTGASIAVCRQWVGLASVAWATLLTLDTPGTSTHSGAAFRYSTAATDANWKAVTFDGASQTIVDTGVPVVASTAYKFEISDNGNATTFLINGIVVASIATTRPAATVACRMGMGIQTLEAVLKIASFGWLFCETD